MNERLAAALAEIRAVKNNSKRRRMEKDLLKAVRKVQLATKAKVAR